MVTEIYPTEKKKRCDMKCGQWAAYVIYGRKTSVKVCSSCAAQLVRDLCQYGFAGQAAQKAIEERVL